MMTDQNASRPADILIEQNQRPLLLSVPQAAHLLGIGATLCWEMVYAGRIPSVRLGRRVLIPRAAVEKLARIADISAGDQHDQHDQSMS